MDTIVNRTAVRAAVLIGMGIGTAVIAPGCQTTTRRVETSAGLATQPVPGQANNALNAMDSGVVRTEFRAEIGPEQRVKTHLDLGRAMEAQGNFEAAVGEYQKALESAEKTGNVLSGKSANDEKALAQRRMAAALDRLGRFAQAEVHYREALRLSPDDPKVWNDAGYSAYLQHRWVDAEQRLRTAARLAPQDARVSTNLGLCLAANGKLDKALEELSKAGGAGIGHANMAYVLAAMGKVEDAKRHYRIALQFEPQLEAARVALAKLDARPNGPDGAMVADARHTDPSLARTSTTTGTAQPTVVR